jgi:hypothetical protein
LAGEAAEKAKQWAHEAEDHEVNAKEAEEMADTAISEVGAWRRKEREIEIEIEKCEKELDEKLEGEWMDEKLSGLIERVKMGRGQEGKVLW